MPYFFLRPYLIFFSWSGSSLFFNYMYVYKSWANLHFASCSFNKRLLFCCSFPFVRSTYVCLKSDFGKDNILGHDSQRHFWSWVCMWGKFKFFWQILVRKRQASYIWGQKVLPYYRSLKSSENFSPYGSGKQKISSLIAQCLCCCLFKPFLTHWGEKVAPLWFILYLPVHLRRSRQVLELWENCCCSCGGGWVQFVSSQSSNKLWLHEFTSGWDPSPYYSASLQHHKSTSGWDPYQ